MALILSIDSFYIANYKILSIPFPHASDTDPKSTSFFCATVALASNQNTSDTSLDSSLSNIPSLPTTIKSVF